MNKPESYFEINELISRLLELKDFNLANALATILNTPTIKIVRCANCKHCQEWNNGNPPTCRIWTDQWDMSTELNGYCHYGELKDSF